MSLWTLAGCVLIGIVAGAVPPLWEGRRMRRDHYHDCRFTTARVASAEPGQILACSFCGEPARVDADGWDTPLSRAFTGGAKKTAAPASEKELDELRAELAKLQEKVDRLSK